MIDPINSIAKIGISFDSIRFDLSVGGGGGGPGMVPWRGTDTDDGVSRGYFDFDPTRARHGQGHSLGSPKLVFASGSGGGNLDSGF